MSPNRAGGKDVDVDTLTGKLQVSFGCFLRGGGVKNAVVCVSEDVDTKPPPDSVLISLPFFSSHRSGPHACHRYELCLLDSKRLQSEDSLTLPHRNQTERGGGRRRRRGWSEKKR